MKLAEAIRIVQNSDRRADKVSVYLACGFLPLHLATFLEAHLTRALPDRHSNIDCGLYGDMRGNLERLKNSESNHGVAVFEWEDFDPRLGLRSLGGWSPELLTDIADGAQRRAEEFAGLMTTAAAETPIVVSLPTLPLPPISYQRPEQSSQFEIRLTNLMSEFAVRLGTTSNVKILNQERLDALSPRRERRDVKTELAAGFPYHVAHASHLAEMVSQLIAPSTAKKGLITDLDDTLWRGIVGEDGPSGISWHLHQQSHSHALYQQLLLALAQSGVLLGVASKNDEALALKAFERDDLILERSRLFPLEINWQDKSQSVRRILEVWNISPDSVVFVDDSAHDVAEVKAAFPAMECLRFPAADDAAAYEFLVNLRGMFGKDTLTDEDAIRMESVRNSVNYQVSLNTRGPEDFLAQVDAELIIDVSTDRTDERALELINKTNQFNLNGRRLNATEFKAKLSRPNSLMLVTSYKDKYGPLGKVSVLLGTAEGSSIKVDTWVMSCRAFSRRIEHACLDYLFEKFGATRIVFEFEPTERNRPFQEFLTSLIGEELHPGVALDKERFANHKPALHHTVKELAHA